MAAYLWSHQTFHASALQTGTKPIYTASPAHPHLYVDSRATRERWCWKANYLLTWFHICIYICAMNRAVPSAHMSLLIIYILTPYIPLPPLSLFLGIQLSFPRTSENNRMASPYSYPFSNFLEQFCAVLSVFYIFTPTEEAWDVGFYVYMSLTATGGI